jgi:DUF4097 and DUF4098 domain-containing protein YvlB
MKTGLLKLGNLMLFVFLLLHGTSCTYADDIKTLHEKTFPTTAGKELKVETSMGDVLISTSANRTDVYVKVVGNQKAEDRLDFRFESDDNGVRIYAKKKSNSPFNWFSNTKLRFEIILPNVYNATVLTAGGDIKVKYLTGTINFKTSGGDIVANNTDGYFYASTSGGDINLNNRVGETKVSTSGGDIKIDAFKGNINASTSGGDVVLSGSDSKVDASTSGGDIKIEYGGENKGIELSTSGGDIDVLVPADFNAKANLRTSGGDISCNLSTNNVIKISSSRFEADLNQGGNPLICKTSGGDITVKKK